MTARPSRGDALTRCVGDPETFAHDHWGRCPLLRRGDDPFDDVLSLAAVDTILSSAARRPEVRLVQGGERVDAADYCTTLRLGGRIVSDVVDPVKVGEQLLDGATVVLQSLHRTVPAVQRFALQLESQVSHPVQANAYLTPAGASGLAAHRDGHDVVVVQLHGAKCWTVDGLGELVLTPGDTLYLPAGTEHSATAQASASLHLTIGMLRVTYRAVLQRALEDLDVLDQPLPLGYATDDDGRLVADVRAMLDGTRAALASADAVAVAERERRRRRPRPSRDGHVASLARLGELDLSSVVRVRAGPPPRIEVLDGDVRLDLGDRTLRLPAAALPALRVLVEDGAARIGDLPGLDDESRLVVARRLTAEGMTTIDAGLR
jgi:uncharacterized RmlC-like cupin family protein